MKKNNELNNTNRLNNDKSNSIKRNKMLTSKNFNPNNTDTRPKRNPTNNSNNTDTRPKRNPTNKPKKTLTIEKFIENFFKETHHNFYILRTEVNIKELIKQLNKLIKRFGGSLKIPLKIRSSGVV